MTNQIISLSRAVLCVGCFTISDTSGDTCPACADKFTLLNLARILTPHPELGSITFLFVDRDAGVEA